MEQNYNVNDWTEPCPKYDCRKTACKCGLKYVNIPTSLGDDSTDSNVAPKNGAYCNALVVYEANGHVYIYSQEGVPTLIDVDASDISTLEQEVIKAQKDVHELREDIDRFAYFFDTASDMKNATNLSNGDIVKTLGYYEKSDGGSACYKIRNIESGDNVDEMFLLRISGEGFLVAELIPDYRISARQVGILGDGVTNESVKIQTLLNSGFCSFFPSGTYLSDQTIEITTSTIDTKGEGRTTIFNTIYSDDTPVFPVIDFSSADVIYVDGMNTTNSSFQVYPVNGSGYIQAMREKKIFIRELHCETISDDVTSKTNWSLFINNPAPSNYSDQYKSGNYTDYGIEINNYSGYNAININNTATNSNGDTQSAPDNSAIGITDRVNSSAPVIYIDQYASRDPIRIDRRGAPLMYRQDNTIFDFNANGSLALGCKVAPNDKLKGYASLRIHSEYPSICLYKEDSSENITRFYGELKNSSGLENFQLLLGESANPSNTYDITDKGFRVLRFTSATMESWTVSQLIEGMMVYNSTVHKPLWFNGTVWIDGAGNTVITPAT